MIQDDGNVGGSAEDLASLFFDGSRFVTRDCCGEWHPALEAEYIIANLAIFAAYVCLPIIIWMFRESISKIADDAIFRSLFAGFVLTCGVGHLEGVISFAWTQYHLFAQWHFLTAVMSWLTIWRFCKIGLK